MKEKTRYVLGAVTISAVLGFTAYAIYEYKKLSKQMEEAITIDQAKREVEEVANKEIEERYENGETDGLREEMVEIGLEEYENPTPIRKEDEELRHDPNSREARDQFIRMKVAEWAPGDGAHDILMYLFTFPFTPTSEEDKLLRKVLMYNREEFFGSDSTWNSRITWGDVILHYAENLEFNLGHTVVYWAEFILDNMGINTMMSSETVDQLLEDLTNHTFWNDFDQFGLFGLDDDQLDNSYLIADDQVDPSLTFDIQFNEYLKGWNGN